MELATPARMSKVRSLEVGFGPRSRAGCPRLITGTGSTRLNSDPGRLFRRQRAGARFCPVAVLIHAVTDSLS